MMSVTEKQICTRCVMDNVTDPTITFKNDGTCSYCNTAIDTIKKSYFPDEQGKIYLDEMFARIKREGEGKKYDCMLGLSGGLDSTYALYIAHGYGLRILAVHIDDGFDAPVTQRNINRICEALGIDLIRETPDKEPYIDLIRSFILAGVPDIAVPQDNVLFAALYRYARQNKIKYFISGANFSLESITQKGFDAYDKVHILDIHNKFGRVKIKRNFPLISIFEKKFKYGLFYNIKTFKPLNYISYDASQALKELNTVCGYEDYGKKHWESLFTKFMQAYYLPVKFGVDKRKAHYSSLIISGQMSRKEALTLLEIPQIDDVELIEEEKNNVLKQLNIDIPLFNKIMKETPVNHERFKSSLINRIAGFVFMLRQKYLGY